MAPKGTLSIQNKASSWTPMGPSGKSLASPRVPLWGLLLNCPLAGDMALFLSFFVL